MKNWYWLLALVMTFVFAMSFVVACDSSDDDDDDSSDDDDDDDDSSFGEPPQVVYTGWEPNPNDTVDVGGTTFVGSCLGIAACDPENDIEFGSMFMDFSSAGIVFEGNTSIVEQPFSVYGVDWSQYDVTDCVNEANWVVLGVCFNFNYTDLGITAPVTITPDVWVTDSDNNESDHVTGDTLTVSQ